MGRLRGTVVDDATGQLVHAKVHVLSARGNFVAPVDSFLKVGAGLEFFYVDGAFEVDAPFGQADVVVERGAEYTPLRAIVDIPASGFVAREFRLSRWTDLPSQGWHPGNTHLHYREFEMRPTERLRFDAAIEGYSVLVVSVLKRRELAYASNTFPIGLFTDLCTPDCAIDVGEESRHNLSTHDMDYGGFGYGHVMLINIHNLIDPVSTGTLVSDFAPDYPPLCYVCDDANAQGGTVIWCHNGRGMEAPVAAVLGKLHAFNMFDPYWQDPEYQIWYHLLNAEIRLPASTGTDWHIQSSNRVYAYAPGAFSYEGWIAALRAGRTFISNGPALFFEANGEIPGGELGFDASGGTIACQVRWKSHYPADTVELIHNGRVAARHSLPSGATEGVWETEVHAPTDGWVAARLAGRSRDSFGHAIFAHTSPVYIRTGQPNPQRAEASRYFVAALDKSLAWIQHKGRYTSDEQRESVARLFREARGRFAALTPG